MSLPLFIRPEAEQDLASARAWYNGQRRGLGAGFIGEITAALERISSRPGMYDLVHVDVRACRVHRFPYLVYFRVLSDRIEVLAVLHGSRHPSGWQERS